MIFLECMHCRYLWCLWIASVEGNFENRVPRSVCTSIDNFFLPTQEKKEQSITQTLRESSLLLCRLESKDCKKWWNKRAKSLMPQDSRKNSFLFGNIVHHHDCHHHHHHLHSFLASDATLSFCSTSMEKGALFSVVKSACYCSISGRRDQEEVRRSKLKLKRRMMMFLVDFPSEDSFYVCLLPCPCLWIIMTPFHRRRPDNVWCSQI